MNNLIMYVITIFFVLGSIDYLLGNKFGLGEKFEGGIKTLGPIGLAMIGIYSITPIMAEGLKNFVIPLGKFTGIDPSIFISGLLAPDMGGYLLCKSLNFNENIGSFAGVILSSGLGTTISFTIPLALGMIKDEHIESFSQGAMAGLIALPFGGIIGGLFFNLTIGEILISVLPILIISVILAIGLLYIPQKLIKVFGVIGKIIILLSVGGLLIVSIQVIAGIKITDKLIPFEETMSVVGKISLILAGAYPMVHVITRTFKESFRKIGRKIGINNDAVGALFGNLASNLLTFGTFDNMNEKGRVVCTAFGVGGAFVFGGQLAFIARVAPKYTSAFIVSKFSGGILSIIIAILLYDKVFNKKEKKSNYHV